MTSEIGFTQTILVGDISGKRGNCLQAAVATWLKMNGLSQMTLEEVPDFANFPPLDDNGYSIHWWRLFLGFFAEKGYAIRSIGLSRKSIPDELCLVYGDSPRGSGIKHVVVAQHGCMVWDPHPSRDGLVTVQGAWIPESLFDMRAIKRFHDSQTIAQRIQGLRGALSELTIPSPVFPPNAQPSLADGLKDVFDLMEHCLKMIEAYSAGVS